MKFGKKEADGRGAAGLVPVSGPGRPLSEAQEAFRKLLARVEFLRESIDSEQEKLDAALSFYAAEIVPRLSRQSALQKDFVRALAPCLNATFFPRKLERLEIKELIREFLNEIAKTGQGLADSDLRDIYTTVHGVGYAEQEQKTLSTVKESLARMFAEAGLEADFSELECAASEAEFMARAEEISARVRKLKQAEDEAAHCHDLGNHSTDDEQLRAAEEQRKRSVANIYKQLARVLHPDLERDKERQKEKVQLMQELTVAFRENDLHTLLRLEMEWIENEGGDVEHLTNEKLGVYSAVLSGQVEGLESRLRGLAFHSRYRPVVTFHHGMAVTIDGAERVRALDESIAAIEGALAHLRDAGTPEEVSAAVRPFRPAAPYS